MDKIKVKNIVDECENKSNKDLIQCQSILGDEFEKTKELIINLTRHLETVEKYHDKITKELKKRKS